ncbi:MAG TPA: C2 family cysteine protease, partial [Tepidisphaeraceae bacterium]|nr:C2 family cysteine protease [Tepidisphaeraceae bacterium]
AQNSIWVPIMEKAFAFWRSGSNSYGSISGGSETEEFYALGGSSVASIWGNSAAATMNNINAALTGGKQVSVWTPNSDPTNGCPCVKNHVYTADHVNYQSVYVPYIGVLTIPVSITLRNPWGTDGGGNNDGSNDGYVTVNANTFYGYFGGGDSAFV